MRTGALALLLGCVFATPSFAALKPGDAAPDFTAKAALGGEEFTFSLASALKKGPVVLYFFPKAFTTGCTANTPAWRLKASMARWITGTPPMVRYCFGPPAPARSPRPAATRTTAVRSDFAMRLENSVYDEERNGEMTGMPLARQARKKRGFPGIVGNSILLHCT